MQFKALCMHGQSHGTAMVIPIIDKDRYNIVRFILQNSVAVAHSLLYPPMMGHPTSKELALALL